MAEQLGADAGDILDIDRVDLRPAEAEDLAEPGRRAVRIDNRDRAARFQRSDQRARRGRRMRVRQRLVQRVAAADIVEGLDAQSHSGTLHRDAAARSTGSAHAGSGPRGQGSRSTGCGIAPRPSGSFRRNRTKPTATARVTSTATNPPATTSLR